MRRNSTLVVLALAVVLVSAGVAAAVSSQPTQSNDAPGESITVGASGAAETTPDQAVLHVAVVRTGDSASAVRQQLADNVSSMRAALREQNVSADQIRTTRYDISQNHRAERGSEGGASQAPAYRGVHEFRVTLTDLDKVGTVIDAAVENGATQVDNVRFTLSSEKERELRKEALQDAMTNARGQADTLAAASELSVTGVHSVSTTESHYPRYEAASLAGGDGGTSVESGPVTVAVQVQVTYNATDA